MPAARRAPVLASLFAVLACFVVLAGAGSLSPAAAASGPAVVIVALTANGPAPGAWSCLGSNPACTRHDPWWQEALLQAPAAPGSVVEFSPLGAGLTADPRLAEAVLWLWSWPEGRGLLRAAAAHGVAIRVTTLPAAMGRLESAARYDPRMRAVEIDGRFLTAPSWLLGDLLAHELTHATQDAAGQRFGTGQAACIAAELPARRNEVAYVRALFDRLGAPPSGAAASLSAPGAELLQMAEGLLDSADLPGIVAGLCAAGGA
ncbi:MAG TPA: hypothetical protein VFD32_03055 [Dehalococcoidia bacterium]|nr:hypothetical protein [Dehalococcoidia bacterium]